MHYGNMQVAAKSYPVLHNLFLVSQSHPSEISAACSISASSTVVGLMPRSSVSLVLGFRVRVRVRVSLV